MSGAYRTDNVPASDILDFEADANWFLARAWRGVFAVAGAILLVLGIVTVVTSTFRESRDFVFLGRPVHLQPVDYRVHLSAEWILPILILGSLIVLNRWASFIYIRNESDFRKKKKVFHRFVYLGELLSVMAMKYSGGVESPMFLYFLGHTVALSSVVPRKSLARHIAFLSVLFIFVAASEFTGFIYHTDIITPPPGLYKSSSYVLLITLGVIGYMCYIGISSSNIFRKLDERRQAMAQAEKSGREAQLYLDIMAHDFSNHSQVVMGNLGLIEKNNGDDKTRDYVKKCKSQLLKCERLISRAGIFAAINGIGPDALKPVEINNCIEQSVAAVKAEYPGALKCFFKNDSPKSALGNHLLKTVFISVIENSIEHSNSNSANVRIHVEEYADNCGEYWMVKIEDEGPGVPDEMKEKIFNRFSKIGIEKGSGLSLSLASTILEKFGGRIAVEDRRKEDRSAGAVFSITLPKA